MKKRIIILGAGLAGLSVAWHLEKQGQECLVFEKEAEIGGLCRSKQTQGFTFDYDGHLLHFRHKYSADLVKGLLAGNLVEHTRDAWVYSHQRYIPYPFQVNLFGLPSDVVEECLSGFIRAHSNGGSKITKDLRFSQWILEQFGPGIARHFMLPYNTKFWTLPPEDLTCEWLDGFIPVPKVSEIIRASKGENHQQFGYNAHFWYPKKGGIANLPQALASGLRNVHTDCQVKQIDLDKKEITLSTAGSVKYDILISTLPLPELPRLIRKLPLKVSAHFKKLRWNSIFNLNLGFSTKEATPRHWVYFPQPELAFFRVGFWHSFSASLSPKGSAALYAEVSYSKDSPLERINIVRRIKDDLKKLKIIERDQDICLEDSNDIQYGYPIYDANYSQARNGIIDYLQSKGVSVCGRYGCWQYFSMEDTILNGRKIAQSLSK